MLEIKNLAKTYKSKRGVSVTAVDHLSLQFPNKGMVFILGKSGSGKSTLLNLLGGLDQYDEGEIIIHGQSSASFKQQHFDSYRNTYLGFIFQEYNILEEFSVGANIALALELQGKKATDEEINDILKQVDLEGYGNRKPNELSGGQKQRVAIARALVKKPEIIMADEPTGALDSETGKQVLDTLKKLSQDKLVIVVSHDREFAEKYADRIIELKNGQIIDDREVDTSDIVETTGLTYEHNTVIIPSNYHLSEDDRVSINHYIDQMNQQISLNIEKPMQLRKFKPTVQKENPVVGEFELIKSKLSIRNAFIIGGSSLKFKKIRLFFTILLTCVALGLFSLADTFGSYDHVRTCTNSIIDSHVDYTTITREERINEDNDYRNTGKEFTQEEINHYNKQAGTLLTPVYLPKSDSSFKTQYNQNVELSKTQYHIYAPSFSGVSEISPEILKSFNYEIIGNYPDGNKNEIAISQYVAQTFIKSQYSDGSTDSKGNIQYQDIKSAKDLIGKTLNVYGKTYTITGIVDTHFDLSRYVDLTKEKEQESTANQLVSYALYNELSYIQIYSMNMHAMVGTGGIKKIQDSEVKTSSILNIGLGFTSDKEDFYYSPVKYAKLSDQKDQITWLTEEKDSLKDNEIIVSSEILNDLPQDLNASSVQDIAKAYASFKITYNQQTDDFDNQQKEITGLKIVGYIDINKYPQLESTMITNEKVVEGLINTGSYTYAIGPMPTSQEDVHKIVETSYEEGNDLKYPLANQVTFELDTINSVVQVMADVCLYIGLGFAIFAAIMFANFISMSISYKKQEIGILRAIGARSNDVFRIFFSESFIIAMINFVLTSIGLIVVTTFINDTIRTSTGLLITVFNPSIRQFALIFLLSSAVAFVASFIPVKRIASKKPIDAIKNK